MSSGGAGGGERAALQVRTWTSWHRWVTLAMLALAFLTVAALAEHAQPPPPGMIPLTRNEIAHLAVALLPPPARGQGPSDPLAQLAPPPPIPCPGLPLPAASHPRSMRRMIYGLDH
jgi:hypothetical protein